jgi:hypothetical protein
MWNRELENTKETVTVHNPVVFAGGTFGGIKRMVAEATGTSEADASFTIAVNIPNDARIIGAQFKVLSLLSGGSGPTWTATFATGCSLAIIAGCSGAAGTKVSVFFDEAGYGGSPVTTDVTTIAITPSAGDFYAGARVTAIVYYEVFV